jgi:CDP-glucose 4,6-dehydratase
VEGLVMRRPDARFWRDRPVLVTGHTGFKGSWLALLLDRLGARVAGFALPPEPGPAAFTLLGIEDCIGHREGDIRDRDQVASAVEDAEPAIVFHLAAQALVGRSYRDPLGTFATNVNGTLHVLDALRGLKTCAAAVVVTSDKVYRNDGRGVPFREHDPLGGDDPYSASKAACEIGVGSFAASFAPELPPLATARAGNVIGGGDFGEARLIPDLVRAETAGETLRLRRPDATRPFQHVLDVLTGYLLLAEDLVLRPAEAPRAVNFGPVEPEIRVRDLLDRYGAARGRPVVWTQDPVPPFGDAPRLSLASGLARGTLGWQPVWEGEAALRATAAWYETWMTGGDVLDVSLAHVDRTLGEEGP